MSSTNTAREYKMYLRSTVMSQRYGDAVQAGLTESLTPTGDHQLDPELHNLSPRVNNLFHP